MKYPFLVRVQPRRTLSGANEIRSGLRARAEIEVAGEQVDDVVARSVHRFRDFCDTQVELTPPTSQQSRIRRVLYERVVKDHDGLGILVRPFQEAASDELVDSLGESVLPYDLFEE